MNSRMTTNSQLSTTLPKKKTTHAHTHTHNELSKQEQQQIYRKKKKREREITWRVISGQVEGGEWRKKIQGVRSINGKYKIDRGG